VRSAYVKGAVENLGRRLEVDTKMVLRELGGMWIGFIWPKLETSIDMI
jgi:hypothetical protein